MSDGIENTIGWGEGSVNNIIGWGQAQEAWCEITPSSPATVKNSDESYNTTVAAGGTLSLPDITVTDSDGSTFTAPSVQDITCTPSAAPVGATLMKTGQTTSYRTGDDGDLEAGRATSFTVLASNNPFGNTNRFTDELGGQTYTNNIVIDWSTYNGSNVLGYKRTNTNVVSGGWNNAIDTCLSTSIGTFTSGWRLANVKEWENILNRELSSPLGYAPFTTFTFIFSAHTSSTYRPATSAFSWGLNNVGSIFPKDKNENSSCLVVRNFTVTGTTLT
jgi:hypothetical protein